MAEGRLAPAEFLLAISPEAEAAPTELEKEPARALFRENQFYPDELPGVRDLSNDFKILLSGYSSKQNRAKAGLEYAGHLRARYDPGCYSVDEPEYIKDQIMPRLYLDMMILSGQRAEYHTLLKHIGKRRTDASLPGLHRLIGAKLDVQADIEDYYSSFPDKEPEALFGNLAIMVHHGRRTLFGDEVTHDKANYQNVMQLLSLLAEYKVLSALHEEWPEATFGTIEEDQNGTDIVIPSKTSPGLALPLQVKSKIQPETELTIAGERMVPEVRVPMNLTENNPFRLSGEHKNLLRKFVKSVPPAKLAVAV